MDLFTMDNYNFLKIDEIDLFESAIWTERYYGDGEVELVVPPIPEIIEKLPKGRCFGLVGSKEPMIIETHDIANNQLKVSAISLTQWLNNRFIRTSASHDQRYWNTGAYYISNLIRSIVLTWCIDSEYLNGAFGFDMGVPEPWKLKIPSLILGLGTYETYETPVDARIIAVPFGPVYDAIRELGITYNIGMKTIRTDASDAPYNTHPLNFITYIGVDRTSGQTANPVIRFSPKMDSFDEIKEIQSISDYKTNVYSYAPANPGGLATTPGTSIAALPTPLGFDVRALMTFEEDISTPEGATAADLIKLLNDRAAKAAANHKIVKLVDGIVTQTDQIKYGVDYRLGDIVEVEGYTGTIQKARITEYIRSQDKAGERAYPTLSMID